MTTDMMTLRDVVEKSPDAVLLGEMIGFAAGRLMEMEVGAANNCKVNELLAHIGVDTRQVAMPDFEVEVAATTAEKISLAARVAAETVQSLTFGTMTQTEALMMAQVAFQSCPDGSRRGIAFKQWRKLWAFDCQICGTRLLSILIKPDRSLVSEKLVRRARSGAGLLGSAVMSNCANKLRRAMRAATCAKALKSVGADTAFAFQSPRPDVRLFCLTAITAAQSRPLVKAAMFSTGRDGYARVALLPCRLIRIGELRIGRQGEHAHVCAMRK